ncbi:MAG: protein phosphatase 2C domain-containing protein [Mycoplasmoidaceae bacterium]|nr:protein phosphatase 2C domain-containing protein [Mycoplasmoidaceae bacterium]
MGCSFNLDKDFCAIVCDGVGSVEHSEEASKIVADTFTTSFAKTKNLTMPTA